MSLNWRQPNTKRKRNPPVPSRQPGAEKASDHDTESEKPITAYKWSLLHTNNVRLVMPPTVTLELASARHISVSRRTILLQDTSYDALERAAAV